MATGFNMNCRTEDGIVICEFEHFDTAYTLSPKAIGKHGKWILCADIVGGWYEWINYFTAHRNNDWVNGDFEKHITASSFEALGSFLDTFGEFVQEWDYADI